MNTIESLFYCRSLPHPLCKCIHSGNPLPRMNMEPKEILEQDQFEELIQGLMDKDYGCCNDFILPSTVNGLRANIQRLKASGDMMPSGVGNNSGFQKNKSIRGDNINWIEDQSSDQFEMIYLKKIQGFIAHLNSTCFTSIKNFESHYSTYEKKNFYARHLDQFKTEKGRKFSIVLYLNKNWQEKDGGMLALHPKGGEQINIAPLGGRIVFFRSDEMEHEVQASLTRERRSIAGWMKN